MVYSTHTQQRDITYVFGCLALQVFVSDGAKCDIARLQMMFGQGVVSAVQVCH